MNCAWCGDDIGEGRNDPLEPESCAQPIGISEEDPRRNDHDEECCACPICEDDVPIILFRGEGKNMKQAAFHNKCFEKLLAKPEKGFIA